MSDLHALDQLVSAIRDRIQDSMRATEGADVIQPKIYPPISNHLLDTAEQKLGFPLPSFLRRLYLEVGNGGYGPGYGLLGVSGGATDDGYTIVDLYRAFRTPNPNDSAWLWPEYLLPICHLGCGMYACSDCLTEDGAIVWFEPNPREPGEPLQRFLLPVTSSMMAWFEAWLRDEDWYTTAYDQSELKRWKEENNT